MDTNGAIPTRQFNYGSRTMNSLYGGQIGIDTLLYSSNWLRVESVLKGGAFYNLAVSQNTYTTSETPADNFDTRTTAALIRLICWRARVYRGCTPTSCLDFRRVSGLLA